MNIDANTNTNTNLEQVPATKKKDNKTPHIWTFVVSIVLTILAFFAVANDMISLAFAIPFILGLAVIQALFQAYVWMHLEEKGNFWPILLMSAGFFFSVMFVAALKLM